MIATKTTANNFYIGVIEALSGFGKIFQPEVRLYIIIPLLINFLVFATLFYFFAQYGISKLDFLNVDTLPSWLQWKWIGSILSAIKVFLLMLYFGILLALFTMLATICANILGAPFNGLLSEAYATKLGYKPPPISFGRMIGLTLKRETIKLLYYLPRGLLVLILAGILYFIPLLNLAIPVLFLWFSSWMLSVQYIDYPADSAQIPFKATLVQMKANKILMLGFGLTLTLLSAIPVVNLFVMPSAVLSATKLWHMNIKDGR